MRPEALARRVATWARQTGRSRPKSKEGWDVLVSEFLAHEVATFARQRGLKRPTSRRGLQELVGAFVEAQKPPAKKPQLKVVGPTWEEIPEDRTDMRLVDDGVSVQIEEERPRGTFKDDFDKLLEDRATASVGPNGEHLDDFDREWQLQQGNQVSTNEQAPYSRNAPPSAINANLGRSVQILSPGGSTNALDDLTTPIEVGRWEGESHEATSVSCIFTAVGVPTPITQGITQASRGPYGIGMITYGNAGYSTTIEIDIGTGVQVTVSASNVSLAVKAGGDPGAGPVTYTGIISFFPTVRTSPVYRTIPFAFLPHNSTTPEIPVPAFARRVIFGNAALSGQNVAYTWTLDDLMGVTWVAGTQTANTPMTQPIEIPGPVQQFTLTNNDNATKASFFAIFELGL